MNYTYCPKCGHNTLEVNVSTLANIMFPRDGSDHQTPEIQPNGDFHDESSTSCPECGFDGVMSDFVQSRPFNGAEAQLAPYEWTEDYNAIAMREGWAIFNGDHIERDDEGPLDSDEEAIDHVRNLADAGSMLHRAALELHEAWESKQEHHDGVAVHAGHAEA